MTISAAAPGTQFAHVAEAQHAVVVGIGDVEVGRVGGAIDDHAGIGAGAVVEVELAAFNQVDGVGVEAILPEHAGGGAEVAGLQGQHDHAIIACIGNVEFVVDQNGDLGAVQACRRRPAGCHRWLPGSWCRCC